MNTREGLVRHLVLAVIGAILLFIASGPLKWGAILDFEWWVWTALLLSALVLGTAAGLLDGAITATKSRATEALAFALDAAILVPLWWIAIFMLGLAGQIDGERSEPATVMTPIVGWLAGPLVLHFVASAFRSRRRDARDAPPPSNSTVPHG